MSSISPTTNRSAASSAASSADRSVESSPDHTLLGLPNELLSIIFREAIESLGDVQKLSQVCQRFNTVFFDELIWKMLANKYGYEQIEAHNWRTSFYLNLEKSVIAIIDQITIPCFKADAQIELVKALPSVKNINKAEELIKEINATNQQVLARIKLIEALYVNIEKANKFPKQITDSYFKAIDQMQHSITIRMARDLLDKIYKGSPDFYINKVQINLVEALTRNIIIVNELIYDETDSYIQLKFVKVLISMGDIDTANKIIDKITDSYDKGLAQLELVKALISMGDIAKANKIIDKVTDSYHKALAQIELVKALPSIAIDTANKFIDEITNSYHKALAQIELVKALPSKETVAKANKFIDEISDSYGKGQAQIELIKALISMEDIDNANKIIDKMTDFHHKALAQIELVKPLISIEAIDKANKIIDKIIDSHDKFLAQIELVKGLISMGDIAKANKIIDEMTNSNNKGLAQIELVKGLLS